MEIKVTGTPGEIIELLQAVSSSEEQKNGNEFRIDEQKINLDSGNL